MALFEVWGSTIYSGENDARVTVCIEGVPERVIYNKKTKKIQCDPNGKMISPKFDKTYSRWELQIKQILKQVG